MRITSVALWLAACLSAAALAQAVSWKQLPGTANDIGVGADGTAWIIGTQAEGAGYGVFRWNGSGWDKIPGSGIRIDVDPNGRAWIVDNRGAVYTYDGQAFQHTRFHGSDVGIGANGVVWIIGDDDPKPNDHSIFRVGPKGLEKMPGVGVRVDVDPQGNAWVITSTHAIFHWTGQAWEQMPGAAVDVGIGGDGTVYATSTDQAVYRWGGNAWVPVPGQLANVSVDGRGNPWGINNERAIFVGERGK